MSADPRSYYDRATSWAVDELEKSRATLRNTKMVAGAAVLVAVVEAFALMLLMPLKSVQLAPILVDRQTGFVEVLNPNGRKDIQSNAALTQALLAQYVIAREGFDITQLPYDYRKVSLWSAGPARQDYLADVSTSNPRSPLHALPRSAVVDVQIKSISPLAANTALVRFRTTRRDQSGAPPIFHDWAAVAAYRFSDAPMAFEDRLSNPLGFQVTRYHREAETLSPPDPPAQPASAELAAGVSTPPTASTPTSTPPPTVPSAPTYPVPNAAQSLAPPVGAVVMPPHPAMKRVAITLCLWMAAGSCGATVIPRPGSGDPRIQTVDYDPEQVVSLAVAPNLSLTLEFSPDERIENVAVGASGAWQVVPNKSADHLFIKAAPGAMTTDMTVITDVRSYSFELHELPTPDPTTPIMVHFRYPQAQAVVGPATLPEVSYYRFSGDRLLHPVDMRDDGKATYIAWAATTPLPAVFIVEPDGHLSLTDGAMRDGRFVIDRIGGEFIFRFGNHEEQARRFVRKVRG